MKNTFKASMDISANDTTVIITLVLGFLITGFLIILDGAKMICGLTSLFVMMVYLDAYLFRPVSYEINDNFLIIHRPIKDVLISRSSLRKIELIGREKLKLGKGDFRILGFFGYFGKFANGQLGRFTMYATRRNKTVLIETSDDGKIVLTPDRPVKFIKHLQIKI